MINNKIEIAKLFNEFFVNIVKRLVIFTKEQSLDSNRLVFSRFFYLRGNLGNVKDIHREKTP